jgi:hypothetical protein
MVPNVPVKVTVGAAVATLVAAANVMICGVPGIRLSVAGEAVTPAGSPDTDTETVPLNEFIELASTEIGAPAPPLVIVADAGVTLSEKSGGAVCIVSATATE